MKEAMFVRLDTPDIRLKESCPRVRVPDTCRNDNAGLKPIEKTKPDLVLSDLEMPTINKFELPEQFGEIPCTIIFTTSYDQYVINSIRFSTLDSLPQPNDPNKLISAVKKVKEQQHLRMQEPFRTLLKKINGKHHHFNKLAVPTSEGFELIPADQLLRCEADDNYTYLYLKNKRKIIACRTLKEMEEQLHDFNSFIRIHHSHIVNLNEVVKYIRGEGGYLVLSDGTSVNVSRSRKDVLLNTLQPTRR